MLTFSDLNSDEHDILAQWAFQDDDDDGYSSIADSSSTTDAAGRLVEDTATCESLGPVRLREEIEKEVTFVSRMLWLDVDHALLLLIIYQWNSDILLAEWFRSSTDVLAAVGEHPVPEEEPEVAPSASSGASSSQTLKRRSRSRSPGPYARKRVHLSQNSPAEPCGICYDSILESTSTRSKTIPEQCGHQFCASCWEHYLESEISDTGRLVVKCMAYQCQTVLLEGFIKSIAVGRVYRRWRTLLINSYVAAQKETLRFCPAPSCDQALHVLSPTPSPLISAILLHDNNTNTSPSSSPSTTSAPPPPSPTVSCANAHTTCFACALPGGHAPVPCSLAALWRALLRADERRRLAEAEARAARLKAKAKAEEAEAARRRAEEERLRVELEEVQETAYWKALHAKSCPQCGTPIERIAGCNQMHCTRCGTAFCWGCGKQKHKNGNSTCNASGKVSPKQAQQRAAAEVERLRAVRARIAAENAARRRKEMGDSRDGGNEEEEEGEGEPLDAVPRFLDGLVEGTKLTVRKALRSRGMICIEIQLLQNALSELTSGAQTLRWTHAMVSLMSASSRKQAFERIHTDLRSAVEQLAQVVSSVVEGASAAKDRRQTVVNKIALVKNRHEVVLSSARKGFVEATWEWSVNYDDFSGDL